MLVRFLILACILSVQFVAEASQKEKVVRQFGFRINYSNLHHDNLDLNVTKYAEIRFMIEDRDNNSCFLSFNASDVESLNEEALANKFDCQQYYNRTGYNGERNHGITVTTQVFENIVFQLIGNNSGAQAAMRRYISTPKFWENQGIQMQNNNISITPLSSRSALTDQTEEFNHLINFNDEQDESFQLEIFGHYVRSSNSTSIPSTKSKRRRKRR